MCLQGSLTVTLALRKRAREEPPISQQHHEGKSYQLVIPTEGEKQQMLMQCQ